MVDRVGSSFSDYIEGGDEADLISGFRGNDSLFGSAPALSASGIVDLGGAGAALLNTVQTPSFIPGDGVSAGLTFTVNQARPPAWAGGAVTATAAAGNQSFASVGALGDGGHVVVWTNGFASGGSGTLIARRFDANGVAVGPEIAVGSVRYSGHTATVGLEDGGFLIIWQNTVGLQSQRYSAGGAAVGGMVTVGPGDMVGADGPAITQLESGEFLVSYSRSQGGYSVWTQRLDANGALSGAASRVNVGTTTSLESDIASLADGGYMATWTGTSGIFVRSFDADGTPRTGDVMVVSHTQATNNFQRYPSLTVLEDGTAVVVWQKQVNTAYSVMVQLIDVDGQPRGAPMQAANTGAIAPRPMVFALEDGSYVLAFTGTSGTTLQRYDAGGTLVGAALTTTGSLAGVSAVALNEAGELIVVSTTGGSDPDITFRRVAVPSALESNEDVAVALSLIMNQVDPSEPGQVRIVGLPAGGSLSAGARQEDGSWLIDRAGLSGLTLTPPPDFTGVLALQATAFTDGDLAHGVTRTFGITFAPLNDAPRLVADVIDAPEDHIVTFAPLANDREVEDESMTVTHINSTAIAVGQTVQLTGVGALRLNADGTLTFTPVANWSGESGFTYTVRDSSGASSTATATLRIAAVTDGATFSYGQLVSWTPVALDVADVRVNTTTVGAQSQSSVAALEDGGYLITWVSAGQDGSGLGIYAQRYDRMGQKVGAEHRVNELTAGDQQHTAVLAMADGGWVIAWSGPAPTGSATAVYARRYDADGAVTQTHLVSDPAFNTQYYSGVAYNQGAPTLAARPDGGFAIGWTTFFSATDNDIWLRQYGADGTFLGGHWVESDSTLEDHLAIVTGANGQIFAIHQEVDGYYNGPTSGWDRDYGIYLERHGLTGALADPIQLNTIITGNQTNPTLAVLANGNMVAAWQSPDASGTGITFRVLNAEGEPILAERRANQTTAGNQTSPSVVPLADGTFIILWTSAGQDGSGAGIYGQRVSADGSLYLGGEFRLNATTAGDQTLDSAITDVSFAVLENGTLVATWWGDGEVHHRRFDPPEAAFTAYQGDRIAIPLTVTLVDPSETFELAISNLPPGAVLSAGTQRADGAWVVTAAEAATLTLTPPPGYAGDMLLRIEITTVDGASRATAVSYRPVQVLPIDNDADGAEVGFRTGADPTTSDDLPVTEVTGGLYEDAGIAALSGGGHVVVWSGQFGDSNGWGIRGIVYGANGNVVSVSEYWSSPDDFTVNTYHTGVQQNPTVLALGDGGFAVFWHSFEQDGSQAGVYGQRFNATGLKVGGEFRVNTTTALAQEAPAATLLSDGGFVVLFEHEPVDGGGFELRGQRYGANGSAVGSEFLVRNMTGGSQRWPDVTALEDGGFVAVWNSFATDGSGMGLEMRVFDARNDATVYRVNQATLGSQTDVKIATLADGSFIAVWSTVADQPGAQNAIHARHFEVNADGELVGDNEFSVFGAGSGTIGYPDVIGLPDGGYIILAQWDQPGDDSVDIYAQRYDADGRSIGTSFRINETSYGDQLSIGLYSDPMVTVDINGDLLVVWTDLEDGNIYKRTFEIDPEPPFVGQAGERIRLPIEVDARDATEAVEIVLSNVPTGVVLSAGTLRADGSWLLAQGELDGLTLATPSAYSGSGFDLIVTVTTRQGTDSFTSVDYHTVQVLPAPSGRTMVGSEAGDHLSGYGGNDTLSGLNGNDVIVGRAGDDVLIGGAGADLLIGDGGADLLQGGSGNDRLDGGQGADRLVGGVGDDVYVIDNTNDLVVEIAGEGADLAVTSVDYTIGPDSALETLIAASGLGAAGGIALTGNNSRNELIGNAHDNVLRGGGGDDSLFGDDGNDQLHGDAGNDGLVGGRGSDTYYVDAGDAVIEAAGQGADRVLSAGDFTLGGGQEVEFLEVLDQSSTTRVDLAGNELGNTLIGGAGLNVLRGEAGSDTLFGRGGDDFLVGGEGADAMYGGVGNDTYYVDNAGDLVVEAGGEGSDRIATSVSLALGSGQSIESLEVVNSESTENIDLYGNAYDQTVAGNFGINRLFGDDGNDVLAGYAGNDELDGGQGHDVLIGGSGVDRMTGGSGSDKYYVDAGGDLVIELAGGGADTVATSASFVLAAGAEVEFLEPVTFSSTDALSITGNEFNNRILGNNGDNVLNGGAGSDTLEGLGGRDTFVFSNALGSNNVDTINDFTVGNDRFLLDSATFAGLAAGALAAGAFTTGSAAADADDRVIYDKATGALWFDADGSGSGAAVQFARVASGLNISASDFVVSGSSASASAMALEDSFVFHPSETAVQSFLDDDFEGLRSDTAVTFGGGDDPHWMLTLLHADGRPQDGGFDHDRPNYDPWG